MKKRVCIYLVAWIFPIAVFWLFKPMINAAMYSIIFSWCWYNIYAIVVPFNIGKNNDFGLFKWLTPILIGFMNALTHPLTFGLAGDIGNGRLELTELYLNINNIIYFTILSLISLVVANEYYCIEKHIKSKSIPFILVWILVSFSPIVILGLFNSVMNVDFYIMFFSYMWYPITSLVLAFFVGKSHIDGVFKWIAPFVICIMNVGAYALLRGLMNVLCEKNYVLMEVIYIIIQMVLVAIGFLMGMLVYHLLNRKKVTE